MTSEMLCFDVAGTRCVARHTGAHGSARRGCVVLAHGFTMTRDAGLDRYAERFAAAGMDALAFDYRCFGESEGMPRQWLDIDRQLEDWRAAVVLARSRENVDRIALWGTSFSGGHVAELAAGDLGIAAVVSQVPFSGLGGRSGPPRVGHQLRMVGAGVRDAVAGRLGRPPRYVSVVPDGGGFAAFDLPGAAEQVGRLVADSATWENRFTPRVVLRMASYEPFLSAARIACPWLLQVCDGDTITPADSAVERASPARQLTVRRHPYAHFEVYDGAPFEALVSEQIAFLGPLLGADPR